ncbi:NAD(P)-dependent oxidoreductase [Leisingera sp. JC1]|uniref:NAD(P)-dependent oxidoreductase n=1 Tax=Leisingera sp. JC1 TaxID=1855282 RepID=UPI0008037DEE|nr:SDR family oxidoreductase [Leisingera sp. JC1]OBY25197.1 flavin reductase [Leisingera sp. JC1]
MKVAVIGATRGIGLELVRAALADGHDVTALVRDPASMPQKTPRLRLVKGSAEDAAAIAEVVSGQEVVCDTLGTRNVTGEVRLFSRTAEKLAAALQPDQLLIAVTGIGAGDSKGHGGFLYDKIFMPLVLRRMYADKDRQEEIIRNKVSRWIIVRPGFLTNRPRTGNIRAVTDLRGVKSNKISRADIAEFILAQAKAPEFVGQSPLLISSGPRK